MIQQLQEIYSSIIPFQKENAEQYQWFITDSGETFGIHQSELTEKDFKLLLAFCKKYEHKIPERGAKEQWWYDHIFNEKNITNELPFRFIYFTLPKNQMEPAQFQEAFGTLFDESLPILWESETEGIIIEEIKVSEEEIHFEHIINILMADLSVNIRFFIGPFKYSVHNLLAEYNAIVEMGEKVFRESKQKVVHYIEAIPYLLVQQLPETERQKLVASILKEFQYDEEMLATLHQFFKHHLNISETAKHLYMHRNSLQYRIDKFSKETGIRVQSFPEALTVKLALLAVNGLDDDE